jgi:hypothetical protein
VNCACCGRCFDGYGHKNRKYCCHQCYVKKRYGNEDEGLPKRLPLRCGKPS